jgi:hypothetical protein
MYFADGPRPKRVHAPKEDTVCADRNHTFVFHVPFLISQILAYALCIGLLRNPALAFGNLIRRRSNVHTVVSQHHVIADDEYPQSLDRDSGSSGSGCYAGLPGDKRRREIFPATSVNNNGHIHCQPGHHQLRYCANGDSPEPNRRIGQHKQFRCDGYTGNGHGFGFQYNRLDSAANPAAATKCELPDRVQSERRGQRKR